MAAGSLGRLAGESRRVRVFAKSDVTPLFHFQRDFVSDLIAGVAPRCERALNPNSQSPVHSTTRVWLAAGVPDVRRGFDSPAT